MGAENPEAAKSLLKVWDDALAYYNANPADGQAIIAEAVGSSVEDLQTAFSGVKFYSLAENQKALSSDFSATIQGCS